MAMTNKDLGSIQVRAGMLKVMLYYDDSVVGNSSHIPNAVDSFVDVGDVVERLERKAGVFEIGDMTIAIKDDYSNYVAGVWYKLLYGSELQIRFYLDEGAGDTFLFWGYLDNIATQVSEKYIRDEGASGRYIRGFSVKLLSLMKKITDASISSLMTTLQGATANYYISNTHYLSLKRLFSAFIKNALGSTYFDQDSSVVINTNNNFNYAYSNGGFPATYTWVGLDKLYIALDFNGSYNYYFDTDVAYKIWSERFTTAGELLRALSIEFGVVPRYYWDITNSRHCFELQDRGRNGSFVTYQSLKASSIQPVSELKSGVVKTIRVNDEEFFDSQNIQKERYDLEIFVNFIGAIRDASHSIGTDWWEQLSIIDGGNLKDIVDMRYWSISAGAMTDTSLAVGNVGHTLEGVRKFYDELFVSRAKKRVRRTYYGLKGSTDSGSTYKHTVNLPGCRTQIHDGIANANYYANEVKKSVTKNELSIEWIGE